MDHKANINSKNNNELVDFLYELLSHAPLNIKHILQLFGADSEKKLAPDLITIKPTLSQQIKAINIVHKPSPDDAILSVIVIFKDQTLDFNKVAKKFGIYKIYENGRGAFLRNFI